MLSLLLISALLVAACGDDDTGAPAEPNGQSTTSTTAAPTDDDGADGEECDPSDPVKFGAMYSLTGPSADLGALSRDGVELAVQDVNADGGVLGRCVELILKDDAGDPTKAAQAARELVDQEEVVVILGPFLSSPLLAALEVTTPARVFQLSESALEGASNPEQFPYSFPIQLNSREQAEAMAAFVGRQGWNKVGIIAVNNAYGTQSIELFSAAVEGTDIEVVGQPQIHESGKADLNAEVGAVVEAGAEVIMNFNVAGPDQTATIRARNQQAPGLPIVGPVSLLNASTTDNFTVEELETVYSGPGLTALSLTEGSDDPVGGAVVSDFLARYRAFKGTDSIDLSISQTVGSYDALRAMAAAIEGAGTTDDPDAIKAWFESNSYAGVRAVYAWSPTSHESISHDQTAFMRVKPIIDGLTLLAPGEG